MKMTADIGVIGLAVMGQNLILNMSDHGFKVAIFNRTVEKVDHFLANEAKGRSSIIGSHSIKEFVSLLKLPRRILLMVKAGDPVDEFIEALLPFLSRNDIIIDGGNSLYLDTKRRCEYLESKGMAFVGCGVSGGEEGARYGPSIMPGGSPQSWEHLKDILQSISAKANNQPCCDWIGPSGSGHFVKMVHNGIEYANLQIVAEIYHICKNALGYSNSDLISLFQSWQKENSDLRSFIIDMTVDILKYNDEKGNPLVESISDVAGQKGTGKWTVIAALDHGSASALFAEAVFARSLSSMKEERLEASKILSGPTSDKFTLSMGKNEWNEKLYQALLASTIISYAQGFRLIFQASKEYQWNLKYDAIAQIWQGGCIIRSVLLEHFKAAFLDEKGFKSKGLLLAPYFVNTLNACQNGWRLVTAQAVLKGIPVPCLSSSLSYYDGRRSAKLPTSLTQAMRDYFGAHTYELDSNPGVFVHTNWTGRGGTVASTLYNA